MKTRQITVNTSEGLHLRVASEVAKICRGRASQVSISCKDCPHVDGCSVIQLLLLAVRKGDQVTVKAEGPDETEAIEDIARVLE